MISSLQMKSDKQQHISLCIMSSFYIHPKAVNGVKLPVQGVCTNLFQSMFWQNWICVRTKIHICLTIKCCPACILYSELFCISAHNKLSHFKTCSSAEIGFPVLEMISICLIHFTYQCDDLFDQCTIYQHHADKFDMINLEDCNENFKYVCVCQVSCVWW